ncbi:MAG TPA: L-aspartate oxidase [Dissulfurispiraceae bacterium]|nr:L-aspartate oxidase [Dissulfurispiraceae bacterium]
MAQSVHTDFLIIGSGVAGLRAAIELSQHGQVMVVTKDIPTESSTEYAQGGVAVALSDEDEVGIHFNDTIKAGAGLCDEEAVAVLVKEGPARIVELIEWGAEFDKDGTKLAFTREGAHSRNRVLHAGGDSTGKEIERTLMSKVKTLAGLRGLRFSTAIDLVISNGVCHGAYILRGNDVIVVLAKVTLLATGGAGQIFLRTTNPTVATGDGVAIALRAGAVLKDMEFVQFHPTALCMKSAPHFLLSEAMRGEGALLRDINGKIFMKDYHSDGELAPRDIVSRAIMSQIAKTKSSCVYLDLTHLDADFVKKRFPRIYDTCLKYGLDITKSQVPVSPAAHYMMGGVRTDLDGVTNIPGLYAAGEVACTGVHGANRLASNSLLEGLVYGYRAGIASSAYASRSGSMRSRQRNLDMMQNSAENEKEIAGVRNSIQRVMWENVGIIRSKESLSAAKKILSGYSWILDAQFATRESHEVKNMLAAALAITEAALLRDGSVGAHYRADFPQRGDNWERHTNIRQSGGAVEISWG